MNESVLYVLLPVYNEGRSIYDLLANFDRALSDIPTIAKIVVVEDCSTDDSGDWIRRACQEFSDLDIRCITHEVNQGLHGSLNTGLESINGVREGDALVTMDGDNTHSPFLISAMLQKLREGADIVIASRYTPESRVVGVSRFRRFLSWGARWAYWLRWRIPGVRDYTSLFRAYDGKVVNDFLRRNSSPYLSERGFTVTTELLQKMVPRTPVVVEVPMVLNYFRKTNVSNMRIGRTIVQTLHLLLKR